MIKFDDNFVTMPGMASVHSHAFQRAMRGLTQRQSEKQGSFWSWRGLMYQLAERLDPETMYAVARLAYLELALSGVTLVGEFHYVHHDENGRPYNNRTELADAVIRAATDVGIRICLIRTAYMRGGYQQELAPAQRRFSDPDVDLGLQDVAQLQQQYADHPLVSVGVAAHSVRAVPIEGIRELADFATQQKLPFHMHVCEQRRELEECVAEHGVTPIQLLHDNGVLSERFVGVHATHLNEAEIGHLGRNHCFVNLCRTTERDLGDGLPATTELVAAGVRLTVGVDSHCCENAFEEVRAIELDERSRTEARTVVGNAPLLLEAATSNGYESCGLKLDSAQDYVSLDRNDLSLVGIGDEFLLDGVVFNGTPRAVERVVVGGEMVVENGRHVKMDEIIEDYRMALKKLVD